jgi:FG-GAP-like repeat
MDMLPHHLNKQHIVAFGLLALLGAWLGLFPGRARGGTQGAHDIFVNSGQALSYGQSSDVALGDLDGDGDLDAFVTNSAGTGDIVWLNDGSATFTNSGQALGSENGRRVALGDVDSDGDLDAYVASSHNKLWINQGGAQAGAEGVFADSGQGLGSALSQDVALGDVDGDGDLDAFVVNYAGANRLWVNQGGAQGGTQGVFTDSDQIQGALTGFSVDLGDVDGDGDLDAVVTRYLQAGLLYLNQGGAQGGTQGIFSSGQIFSEPDSYMAVLGDLDGDTDLDIFFADYNQGNMVWLNQGGAQGGTQGVFNDSGQLLGDGPSRGVALADVDGDADLDAVVANYGAADEVWLNDGLGSFTLVQSLDNVLSYAAALADLDDNGTLDAFVTTQIASYVWLGASHWTAVDPPGSTHSAPLDTYLTASTGADLDAGSVLSSTFVVHSRSLGQVPGHFSTQALLGTQASQAVFHPDETFFPGDLVEASLTGGITGLDGIPMPAYTWQFRTRTLGGTGLFQDTLQYLGNDSSYGVAVSDFDNDGDLDAIVANNAIPPVQVWLNTGGGVFQAGASLGTTYFSRDVVVGDLDGDGLPDAFMVNNGDSVVLRNMDHGNFAQIATVGKANSQSAALGDLDSDGDLDLILVGTEADMVWFNTGSGHFTDSGQELGTASGQDVALGDLDNDGDLDALVANFGISQRLLNDGNGTFTGYDLNASWTASTGVALGDLNNDGWLDAFLSSYNDASDVWLNDGTGVLTLTQSLTPTFSYAIQLGDLDGDGDLDAFVANYNQSCTVWLNDGSGTFSSRGQDLGTLPVRDAALGDLDNDGDLDAFIANEGRPSRVWLNQGPYQQFLPVVRR